MIQMRNESRIEIGRCGRNEDPHIQLELSLEDEQNHNDRFYSPIGTNFELDRINHCKRRIANSRYGQLVPTCAYIIAALQLRTC